MAQPDNGPRLDDFRVTVTLRGARIDEQQCVAYAHSSVTGKETQVSFPSVLGEDPDKTPLNGAGEVASSTSGCDATATALATPSTAAPVSVSVPVPAAVLPGTGIAAAEAYAASVQMQVPDADQTPNGSGEDNLPQ